MHKTTVFRIYLFKYSYTFVVSAHLQLFSVDTVEGKLICGINFVKSNIKAKKMKKNNLSQLEIQ